MCTSSQALRCSHYDLTYFTIQSSWEHPFYPIYFFPTSALNPSSLRESPDSKPEHGVKIYDLVVGDRKAPAAVSEFTGQASDTKDLAGLLKIKFSAADAWLEEDERIYVHPKDPYKVNLGSKIRVSGGCSSRNWLNRNR